MEKKSVLFLCTANSALSVMAEAFFRRAAGEDMDAASAGLDPNPINPLTIEVMREVGIDVADREPHGVGEYLGRRSFNYVVTVCKAAEAACPVVWPFALTRLSWPFEDPAAESGSAEERLAAFRTVRNEIEARVSAWAAELREGGVLP